MPTIKFTADPKLPDDLKHLGYAKGQEHELSADQCDRWIRRDVAEYVSEEELARRAAAAAKAEADAKAKAEADAKAKADADAKAKSDAAKVDADVPRSGKTGFGAR